MSDPQGVPCPYKLSRLLLSDCVNETLKANTNSPFLFRSLLYWPIRPPSTHPNPLSFNPHLCFSTNSWSHLNSVSTFKVCERLFVHTLWSHCPPLNQPTSLFSHSTPSSICIPIWELLRGSWDLRFTSHKSPQIFCLFYPQMVWLVFHTTLCPHTLRIFTFTAQEEILSWRLSHSRSSAIS